jgi:hypothetical protein
VDVTPAATSRCKPDAPRTGRRRRAEHRAAGRHHPHPRDLPERNKLVVLVGSTKDIGQAVRVPAPAGATRPWTTASRQRSTAEGAQPSDHCTSRRFRPTGQAKLNCRCRRTEFISGSVCGTASAQGSGVTDDLARGQRSMSVNGPRKETSHVRPRPRGARDEPIGIRRT